MKKKLCAFLCLALLTSHTVATEVIAPEHVAGAITINTATAKLLFDKDYPFVDVRKREDFNQSHIAGAKHLAVNSEHFTAKNLKAIASKDEAIIFYCNGIHCPGSSKASKQAIEWGWRKILYYREGLPKWQAAGYAVK